MYKTIELTKAEFSTEQLKELKANDCIIVHCDSAAECQRVRATAGQYSRLYADRLKDRGFSKFITSKAGDMSIRITAFL